nr:MAG TPA: hypothetical protein [Caudoviricetes sp.]
MWRYRGHCIYRSVSWFLSSCFVTVFGVSFVCAFIILRLGWYVNNLEVNNYHKKSKINLTEVVHIATNKPCQR